MLKYTCSVKSNIKQTSKSKNFIYVCVFFIRKCRPGATTGILEPCPLKSLLVPPKQQIRPLRENCAPKQTNRPGATGVLFELSAQPKYCLYSPSVVNFRFRSKIRINITTKPKVLRQRPFFLVFIPESVRKNRDPHYRISWCPPPSPGEDRAPRAQTVLRKKATGPEPCGVIWDEDHFFFWSSYRNLRVNYSVPPKIVCASPPPPPPPPPSHATLALGLRICVFFLRLCGNTDVR